MKRTWFCSHLCRITGSEWPPQVRNCHARAFWYMHKMIIKMAKKTIPGLCGLHTGRLGNITIFCVCVCVCVVMEFVAGVVLRDWTEVFLGARRGTALVSDVRTLTVSGIWASNLNEMQTELPIQIFAYHPTFRGEEIQHSVSQSGQTLVWITGLFGCSIIHPNTHKLRED